LHQQQPYSWHSRAGGGAVHSIISGHWRIDISQIIYGLLLI
jgi:hypothetical protein